MPVGTDQGRVYEGSEGTGQAAILGTNPALPYLERNIGRHNAKKQQEIAAAHAEKKRIQDAAKNLNAINPEFWYRHEQEKQLALDEVYNMGVEILSAGADPFSGVDKASQLFQQKYRELEGMSKYSNQVKDLHGKYIEKLDKDPANYSAGSKLAVGSYFQASLKDLMSGNVEPPRLVHVAPEFDLMKRDADIAAKMKGTKPDGWTDSDLQMIAAKDMNDPNIMSLLQSSIDNLNDNQRNMLKNMAGNKGMDPYTYLRVQQIKPHFKDYSDGYDYTEFEKSLKPGYTSSSYENTKGVTTSKSGLDINRTKDYVEFMVRNDSRYLQDVISKGKYGTSPMNTPKENRRLVVDGNVNRLVGEAKQETKTTRDQSSTFNNYFGSGHTKTEVESNQEAWWKDLQAGKTEAAKYLKGLTMDDGAEVTDAYIQDGPHGSLLLKIKAVHKSGVFANEDAISGNKEPKHKTVTMVVRNINDSSIDGIDPDNVSGMDSKPSGKYMPLPTYIDGDIDEMENVERLPHGHQEGSPENLFKNIFMQTFKDKRAAGLRLYSAPKNKDVYIP